MVRRFGDGQKTAPFSEYRSSSRLADNRVTTLLEQVERKAKGICHVLGSNCLGGPTCARMFARACGLNEGIVVLAPSSSVSPCQDAPEVEKR
jgi:hypothetical protein